MSLFRSEEHLLNPTGAVLTLEQTWHLAKAWYLDPRNPAWKPRTIEESQRVLDSVGLTSEFWQLKP